MSITAVSNILSEPVRPSTAKFVLVVLAYHCPKEGDQIAWPSTASICQSTGLDRKTVFAALSKLESEGWIEDTGRRSGATGRVTIYRVNSSKNGTIESSRKRNSSENGIVPLLPPNRPVFTTQSSQKRDEEPVGTVQEPELSLSESSEKVSDQIPEEVRFWNSHPELTKVRAVSSDRKAALRARKSDLFWCQNYQAAVGMILGSKFCLGQNDRGWKADFDWILKPGTVAKIMEGKYDDRTQQTKPKTFRL